MKKLVLLLLCSVAPLLYGQTGKPRAAATVELGPKPTAEDKTPAGDPKFNTYEDFMEALTEWKVRQYFASLGKPVSVTVKEQAPDAAPIADIKKHLDSIDGKIAYDEYLLSNKQTRSDEVILDPAKFGVYQRLDSDPLQYLVSLQSVVPYLNGYKVVVNIGNPTSARFKGINVKLKWTKDYDYSKFTADSFNKWKSSVHSTDTAVTRDILPGSWNPVEIVLLPAKSDELGYLSISVNSDTVSLGSQ